MAVKNKVTNVLQKTIKTKKDKSPEAKQARKEARMDYKQNKAQEKLDRKQELLHETPAERKKRKERAVVLRARREGKDPKIALKEYRERQRAIKTKRINRQKRLDIVAKHKDARAQLKQRLLDAIEAYKKQMQANKSLPMGRRKAANASARNKLVAVKKAVAKARKKLAQTRAKVFEKHPRSKNTKRPAPVAPAAPAAPAKKGRKAKEAPAPAAPAKKGKGKEGKGKIPRVGG